MGQCGCGDFNGDFKFKGPGKTTYVLQIYSSCNDCDNPAGIILYAMSEEDCEEWSVEDVPEIEIQDVGTFFSVIHPRKLMESITEGIEVYVEEGLHDEFRSAVFKSIKDNKRLHSTSE